MARPRKFKSAKALSDAWTEYKAWCDSRPTLTHGFSAKNSEFVSKKLQRSVTYTIEGFCAWVGIARQNLYATYGEDPRFRDTFTCMREECEIDARMKFELGLIDSRLAPLWMSRYGYSTKLEAAHAEEQGDDPLTAALKESADVIRKAD